jgi:hypothetical protein
MHRGMIKFDVVFTALPGPPTNVRVSEITAMSVRLTWSYPGAEDLQYYVLQYKPKYANQAYSEISGIITMYYTVRNLSPYTEYELFVIAVNNIGRGPPSTPAVVTTGETGESPSFLQQYVQVAGDGVYILITSIFCCYVIHCVILAHNCFCYTLTNIVYIYRFRKNIKMDTSKIKSGEICVLQKRLKDVICM